jgi:putative two-component system hydrogenase maturation factor HypX/HoxX
VVHPGIVGDRGPSALDWALQEGAAAWGVTVLQAEAEMDAGPVWATAEFPAARGEEVQHLSQRGDQAAVDGRAAAVERCAARKPVPLAAWSDARGTLRPLMKQGERAIDWPRDDTATVLRKINAADGFPGVADKMFGIPCHIFDAWPEASQAQEPGLTAGHRDRPARNRAVAAHRDGAVWIGHAKREGGFKLPATLAFASRGGGAAGAAAGRLVAHRSRRPGRTLPGKKRTVSAPCISSSTTAPCPPPSAAACAKPWPGPRHARCA